MKKETKKGNVYKRKSQHSHKMYDIFNWETVYATFNKKVKGKPKV